MNQTEKDLFEKLQENLQNNTVALETAKNFSAEKTISILEKCKDLIKDLGPGNMKISIGSSGSRYDNGHSLFHFEYEAPRKEK